MIRSVHELRPTLVVLGATGTGKSDLALFLARQFSGEIVNCDSVQVHRGLDIGSAKTPLEARGDIPHHLLDVVGPGEELSAGAYAGLARTAIAEIHRRERIPVVVGGTGFYLRALLDGLSPAPTRNLELRARLQKIQDRRPGALHRFLRRYDSTAAARIHPNDKPKLIRAIEIMLLTGKPITQAQAAPRDALSEVTPIKIGLMPERALLYDRLNERSTWMFHNGLMEETQRLLKMGYAPDSKALQSVGYKQAVQVTLGQSTLESAIAECQVRTRQYAKRQITWFRRETAVHWLTGFGSSDSTQQLAAEIISTFLNLNLHSFTLCG